jgi:hypothetical protein
MAEFVQGRFSIAIVRLENRFIGIEIHDSLLDNPFGCNLCKRCWNSCWYVANLVPNLLRSDKCASEGDLLCQLDSAGVKEVFSAVRVLALDQN